MLPESALQSLTSTLRIAIVCSISSCSKASRVFSSNCRYPASSPGLYFHRAVGRDSSPDVTLFNASELRVQFPNFQRGTDYIFICISTESSYYGDFPFWNVMSRHLCRYLYRSRLQSLRVQGITPRVPTVFPYLHSLGP
jgi:hypothetical protein